VLAEGGQMTTADRTAIRRRLAVARKAHRPPLGRWQAPGHDPIVARGLRATLAATVFVGVTVGIAALAKAERARRAARSKLDEHNRRFGLIAGEPPAQGFQRIALGQLDIAIEMLQDESAVSPEKAVHETRKALKRLQALLRLLEDELPPKEIAHEQAILRDVATRLARARDAEVTIRTLDELIRRHPRRLGDRRGLIELRSHLHSRRVSGATPAFADAERLIDLRLHVTRWSLSPRPPSTLAKSGLRHIYRDGRRDFRRAGARKPKPTAFHRWRKHVKDLRYAAEALDVRPGDGRLPKLARRADVLGELLGEEHDLAVLADLVHAHKPLRRHKRSRRTLLRTISRRRTRLRERALVRGASLYAPKPNRFLRRTLPPN
jgi:CHAD domain-containing protein